MRQKVLRYIFVALVSFCVAGCGSKKVVARNCEKAGNAELYVCDSI